MGFAFDTVHLIKRTVTRVWPDFDCLLSDWE